MSKLNYKKIFIILIITLVIIFMNGCKKKNSEPTIEEANPYNDVYYELFVRSFADSNNDGIGDFNGIISKLDYLKNLGITGLWLMPINPSNTYHGYDVTDYYNVNSDYGTLDDFKNLCTKAEEKGIKILIDMVINHTSSEHEWFKKALAGDATYQDYYVFTTLPTNGITGSWGQNIWHTKNGKKYCGYFSDTMPDLNYFNEKVKEEVIKIGKFWIDQGVDGFRLDAAQHFYGDNEYLGISYDYFYNIQYLKKYVTALQEYDPDFYVTGEINLTSENIVKDYFRGIESPLDFPIASKVTNGASSNGNAYYVRNIIKIYDAYRAVKPNFISAPFLRNHDEDRLATEYNNDLNKLKLIAEMLMVLPGSPIIYYGEEIGMFGSKSNGELLNGTAIWDETRRLPLNFGDSYTTTWFSDPSFEDVVKNKNLASVKVQLQDDDSLLHTYQRIINVRNNNIALKYGNNIVAYENNNTQLQGFYREYTYLNQHQKLLIIHNLSIKEMDLPVVNGKVIYMSGTTNYDNITKIPGKSTIIYDITGV